MSEHWRGSYDHWKASEPEPAELHPAVYRALAQRAQAAGNRPGEVR